MMLAFIFRLMCTCFFVFEACCLPFQGFGVYSSKPKPSGSASVTPYGSTKGGFSGSSESSDPIVSQPSVNQMPQNAGMHVPSSWAHMWMPQYFSSQSLETPERVEMKPAPEEPSQQSVSNVVEVQTPVQLTQVSKAKAPQQAPVPVQPPVKRVQAPAKVPQQKPVQVPQQKPVQSPVQVIWEEAKAPQQAPVPVQPPVKWVQAPAKVPQQKPVQVVKEETLTPQQAPVPVQPSVELIQAPVQMPPNTEMYMPPSWTNLWMPAPANPYIYLQSPATPERVWMMPAPEEPSQQSVSKVEVQTPVQVIEEETKTPQQAPVHVQAPVKRVQTPAKVPQQKPVQSPIQVIKEETQTPQQAPVPVQPPVKQVQAPVQMPQEEPVQVNVEETEAPVETSSNIAVGSSEPERYIVITSPSGFQTRYIVKSFNRYARGKHVYSQTTYIPLDLPVPVPSDPVKGSQTGKA